MMHVMRRFGPLFWVSLIWVAGCVPSPRLTFPQGRVLASANVQWFDVRQHHDFGISFDQRGRMDALLYDDNGDGKPDRIYHLRDYPTSGKNAVPHLVLMLDSIPYQTLAERYTAGEFRWFDPPVKVISTFPSLTKIAYTRVLHSPPTLGMIDEFYDPAKDRIHSGFASRWFGYREPWEHFLDYSAGFADASEAYLNPRPWYAAELERAHQAFNKSNRQTTIVYLASASCMVCRYGKQGAEEVLDGAARLCLQLLYERYGAVQISMMADHGHNYMESKNIDIEKPLRAAGFHVGNHLGNNNDIVLELSGLVTYAGIDTREPQHVADVLLKLHGIDQTFYMAGDSLIVRDSTGYARIEKKGERFKYTPVTSDVLHYSPLLKDLQTHHKLEHDGYALAKDWFNATVDSEYPNGPPRLWLAFHGEAVHAPALMFTTLDGYCAGLPYLTKFIHMRSTHGSLNQINTATFLLSMNHRTKGAIGSDQVMPTVVPGYVGEPRN